MPGRDGSSTTRRHVIADHPEVGKRTTFANLNRLCKGEIFLLHTINGESLLADAFSRVHRDLLQVVGSKRKVEIVGNNVNSDHIRTQGTGVGRCNGLENRLKSFFHLSSVNVVRAIRITCSRVCCLFRIFVRVGIRNPTIRIIRR